MTTKKTKKPSRGDGTPYLIVSLRVRPIFETRSMQASYITREAGLLVVDKPNTIVRSLRRGVTVRGVGRIEYTYQYVPLRLHPENMTRDQVALVFRGNFVVQTENGVQPWRDHLRLVQARTGILSDERHTFLYRCIGCGRITCGCNGSDPDVRCDACVVHDEALGIETIVTYRDHQNQPHARGATGA